MRTIEINLFTFDELSTKAQEKAVSDQIEFEIQTMGTDSPYYELAVEMEDMGTPWFLGQYLYQKAKSQIEETLRINNYEFYSNGELYENKEEKRQITF